MSPTKGVRKSRIARPAGIKIGKYVVSPRVAVAGLLTAMYAWLMFGSLYGIGDILMQLLYFAIFVLVTFYLGVLQKAYRPLSYAFIAITVPVLFWALAGYAGYGPLSASGAWKADLLWIALTGVISLLLAAGLIAALLYDEKDRPFDIFARPGKLKDSLLIGGSVLALCFVIAAVIVFVFPRVGDGGQQGPALLLGGLLAFSVASGFAEELLFRGLLLSRLLPLVGMTSAMVLQAVAFAAFEAAFFYMALRSVPPAAAVFVISLALGAFWGRLTLREKSILAPALSHAGIYMIIGLLMFSIVSL